MAHQEQVRSSNEIVRTDEIQFLIFRQIAQVDEPEITESDEYAHGCRILRVICGPLRLCGAIRIWLPRPCCRLSNVSSGSSQHFDLDPFNRDRVSRLCNDSFRGAQALQIGV